MDMVLAKTDLAIASRYAELVAGPGTARAHLQAHHGRARQHPALPGADHRQYGAPGRQPLLARSIQNRFAYLDPLNHLQVELIKRHRALSAEARRRARPPRHPPVDQRRGGRPAQHGLTRRAASDSRAGTARAGLCFPRKNILKKQQLALH
jgi:hypothetical protein